MPYPVIERADAVALRGELEAGLTEGRSVQELVERSSTDLIEHVKLESSADFPVSAVEEVATEQFERWKTFEAQHGPPKAQDLWQLEADMAGPVHGCLRDVDVAALADPNLWRYLHLGPFRWYLLTREPEMQIQDYGGTDNGRRYWLLVRTFLWGKHAFDPDDAEDPYRRTTAIGEAYRKAQPRKKGGSIDFWHSYVVRVDFTRPSAVSQAFIDEAVAEPQALDTPASRTAHHFSKRMTRLSRTVDLALVPTEQVKDLVREQKDRTLAETGLSPGSSGGVAATVTAVSRG